MDRIILQVRDPRYLYAYWEVTPATLAQARLKLRAEEVACQRVLRVYGDQTREAFDIGLSDVATDWTFKVDRPDKGWFVEIGLKAPSGRFLALARSNQVQTPPDQPLENPVSSPIRNS